MTEQTEGRQRYFLTYSGVKLPLNLTEELPEASLRHRNTYFSGQFDGQGRLVRCEKRVYGEVEMTHEYDYHGNGALKRAVVVVGDEDPREVIFDKAGRPVAA